ELSRPMRQRAYRSPATLGQWAWKDDPDVELDYHVRLSALPRPGRVRELLELVSRLHGSLLDRHRPLWEFHLVEGLAEGRCAPYARVHPGLMEGAPAVRWMTEGMSCAPAGPAFPPWAPAGRRTGSPAGSGKGSGGGPLGAARAAVRMATEAAGTPKAL